MGKLWPAIAALIMAISAFADSGDWLSRLKDWVFFQGKCGQLEVQGINKTSICDPASTYQHYTNGFVSFTAVAHGDGLVSFSGNIDQQLDPQHYKLQVKRILYVGRQGTKEYRATGYCSVTGTLRPSGEIICDAVSDHGEPFHFEFQVNGFRHLLGKRQFVSISLQGPSI